MNNKRYIRESGSEARIAAIVIPIANDMGFDLVRVKIISGTGTTLQIMAEDEKGDFSIADCTKLSRELSPALDVEEPLSNAYQLEISSPGIDRPLVRARDFVRYIGHDAKIELRDMIDGRKRFRGEIVEANEISVTIKLRDALPDTDPNHLLELEQIAEAKLIMSDKLLEEAQKQQINKDLDDSDIEIIEETIQNNIKENI